MFGIPGSIKILDRINNYVKKDKARSKNYKVIISPPYTLLENFAKSFKNKKISISAQNCFHKNNYGSHTGFVSPYMIKKLGVKHVIIGHSENREAGENNHILKEKVLASVKNNLNFDILAGGETAGIPYSAFFSQLLKKPSGSS